MFPSIPTSQTNARYIPIIRTFMHVKENLFGEDQVFTPMDIVTSSTAGNKINDTN